MTKPNADKVNLDTSNFNNNLSALDTDVQKALETLDDAIIGGGAGELQTITVAASGADYTTLQAAKAAATAGYKIRVLPGTYTITNETLAKDDVHWHFEPGTIINATFSQTPTNRAVFDDDGGAITCVVTGLVQANITATTGAFTNNDATTFTGGGFVRVFNSASRFHVEFDSVDIEGTASGYIGSSNAKAIHQANGYLSFKGAKYIEATAGAECFVWQGGECYPECPKYIAVRDAVNFNRNDNSTYAKVQLIAEYIEGGEHAIRYMSHATDLLSTAEVICNTVEGFPLVASHIEGGRCTLIAGRVTDQIHAWGDSNTVCNWQIGTHESKDGHLFALFSSTNYYTAKKLVRTGTSSAGTVFRVHGGNVTIDGVDMTSVAEDQIAVLIPADTNPVNLKLLNCLGLSDGLNNTTATNAQVTLTITDAGIDTEVLTVTLDDGTNTADDFNVTQDGTKSTDDIASEFATAIDAHASYTASVSGSTVTITCILTTAWGVGNAVNSTGAIAGALSSQSSYVGSYAVGCVYAEDGSQPIAVTIRNSEFKVINSSDNTVGVRLAGSADTCQYAFCTGNGTDNVMTTGGSGTFTNLTDDDDTTTPPGGSTTQLQYNNAGAFGGISTATTDGSIVTLTASGIGVTPTDRLVLNNATNATLGAQQISPSVHFSGRGWKTDAVAGSQSVDFRIYNVPVQSASAPRGQLRFESSINGGAYSEIVNIHSSGFIYNESSGYGFSMTSGYFGIFDNAGVSIPILDLPTKNLIGSWISDGSISIQKPNLGSTTANGLIVENTTPAAVGAQQASPAVMWGGYGWKTNATAASQAVNFRAYVLPVQGAANPTGNWILQHSINGAAYSDIFSVSATEIIHPTSGAIFSQGVAGSSRTNIVGGNGKWTFNLNGAYRWSVASSSGFGTNVYVPFFKGYAFTSGFNETILAGIASPSSGNVEINNGTMGTYRDLQLRNLTASGLTSGRVVYTGTGGLLSSDADFLFDGTTVTLPGGSTILAQSGGTRLNLATSGPSSIGPSGGGETWLAYVNFNSAYMTNSLTGDCAMRFSGRVLLGAGPDSGGHSQVILDDHYFGVGDSLDPPLAALHVQRTDVSDSCSGTPSVTDCSTYDSDQTSCEATSGCTWVGPQCTGTADCSYGDQTTCEAVGCTWGGAATRADHFRISQNTSNYLNVHVDNVGNAVFNLTGTSPEFTFSDPVNIDGTLTLSAQNIATDTTTGMKIGTSTSEKLGFFNATPVEQPTALTTQLTSITHTAPGTPDYAIQDLTNTAPYGFVTKDEGNTVLSVILNLQTRVSELETKIQALGLLA